MSAAYSDRHDELLEALYERLLQSFPKKLHSSLKLLVDETFAKTALRDLLRYEPSDLAGMVVTLWHELQHRSVGDCVQVFNPNIEEHEWQSQHTIITLLYDDIPFIIDSARLALNKLGINIHGIYYGTFSVERDAKQQFKCFNSKNASSELLLCLEIDRTTSDSQRSEIEQLLKSIIDDVHYVVDDFDRMIAKTNDAIQELDSKTYQFPKEELEEAKVLLKWIAENHFSFLAYDEYVIEDGHICRVPNSELGLFKKGGKERDHKEDINAMSEERRRHVYKPDLLIFTKSSRRSTVHRSAYSDYILLKRFNEQGEVIGGIRFLGLYTSSVYTQTPKDIPVVRRKIARVVEQSGYRRGSHSFKEFLAILHNLPRDELIQSSDQQLLMLVSEVLSIQERKQIRLFLRKDDYGKFLNALVYMPRDIFNTQLRVKVHDMLASYFDVEGSDFTSFFSESVLARTRFVFKLKNRLEELPPLDLLEAKIVQIARRWTDELQQTMIEAFGEENGIRLYREYESAFPPGYMDEYSARVAVADVQRIEALHKKPEEQLTLSFFRNVDPNGSQLKLKIFNQGEAVMLSTLIPVLENLGLKVIDEFPYEINHPVHGCTWIYDFNLWFEPNPEIDPSKYRDEFSKAFLNIWHGNAENDQFNRLVLLAKLTWREVAMLRSYARYMKQIRVGLSQEYIAATLNHYKEIANELTELFSARFNPDKQKGVHLYEHWQQKIEESLDSVSNINEDRIIRRYVELINATLRTNFYQERDDGLRKEYMSFKLDPGAISDIPLPRPKFEIFVYSPRIEGVHLRGGPVARGGLRWSDRNEDFRTEVLGLVKAQQVKNAVIVPVGAKGGFVAKQLPAMSDREAYMNEGIESYKTFIRGLLDITDNLIENQVSPPKQVVRYDDDDPYLVVAADKGTATFSDIANGVADDYGFWLGDAFASGGSNGYDHKKMGITAKGAWVSVQRHFRELGVNVQTDPVTVIGVGDMGGDVFGNGLLRSETLKLIGAFNHLHIFIDPDPDPKASYEERLRLFNLPRSSWEDYNKDLISKGGGVFSRSAKSISLTKEIQKVLDISVSKLTPTELVTALLKAPVDLLWNGGIGTYVKATSETHLDIGDKANDALRVNGDELRCKVVGEGGNLGMSQLGRVEFSLTGGRCFTDFIDNAAGVDCSDHEVNIKILLDEQVASGDLTVKQRNSTLEKYTDDVSTLVLSNNYRQTQALGVAHTESFIRVEEYRRLIQILESEGKLDRQLEFLPTDETISERKASGIGLTRPELSVLISYVKGDLKEQLAVEELISDAVIAKTVEAEFPSSMMKQYGKAMSSHRLNKEIVATLIANDMINYMGISFFNRMHESTGCSYVDCAKAYFAAREVFNLQQLYTDIEKLDHQVSSELQSRMTLRVMRMVRRSTRWLIKNYRTGIEISTVIKQFKAPLQELADRFEKLLPEQSRTAWQEDIQAMVAEGVPEKLARQIASSETIYTSLGVIAVAQSLKVSTLDVAKGYFQVGEALALEQFTGQVNSLKVNSHWQALARESFRDDLEWQQRRITQGLFVRMNAENDLDATMAQWLEANRLLVDRWLKMMSEIRAISEPEFSIYSVAIRELLDLSQATMPEL